ncbi:MAG: hypothetical protein HFJ41_03790 [Clostridia bacterium]|nr:hypothetical protein [Clostridia bacterium]
MIIVSQDKDKIFNFNNLTQIYITTDEDGTEYEIRRETVDSLYDTLGDYKTEKRAKEVLQEIIQMIENISLANLMDNLQIAIHDSNFHGALRSVYYMPEE